MSFQTAFIASPSGMSDKVIIIVPKRFHDRVKPLLDTRVDVSISDAMTQKKIVRYNGSVSPMGDMLIVYVPKRYHEDIKPFIGEYTVLNLKEAI